MFQILHDSLDDDDTTKPVEPEYGSKVREMK
jgi:hypothetical protein